MTERGGVTESVVDQADSTRFEATVGSPATASGWQPANLMPTPLRTHAEL